jgi:hypothetical protein
MPALIDLSFEQFVEFQFGHEVRTQGNPWYFDADGDWWWPEPRTGIAYLTRLFSEGPTALQWFSDAQIAQGLTGLISTMAVGDQPWMRDPVTPANDRAAVWQAISRFFAEVLGPRCSPTLGHLSEEGGPLNTVTYMWWESFPGFANPDDPQRGMVDQAELDCLQSVLAIESAACQEAALHGLGHWVRRERRCETIIDAYLTEGRAARSELIAYAHAARGGCIQ